MGNIAALGMVVFILAMIVVGLIGLANYGSYADKKSTDKELVFVGPPLNVAVGVLLSLFFLSASIMALTAGLTWTQNTQANNIGLSIFCLLISCGSLLLIGPDTLTLDLVQNTYVRKHGWIPIIRKGITTEIVAVNVENKPKNGYLCWLVWESKKKMIIGRFKSEGDAQHFALSMAVRLRVPISSE